MIPYEDLVAALSAWRARQGLPVSSLGGATAPAATAQAEPAQSGRWGSPTPPPPPPRAAPPGPPPRTAAPPPLAPAEEVVDDAALLDEAVYEAEGADFAMSFGDGDSATAIGETPGEPPSSGGKRGNRKNDW